VILVVVAASTACGSRDNLFVLDDEPQGSGGTNGQAGSLNFGGVGNANSGGHGGFGNSGGFGNFGGFGNVGNVGNFGGTGFGGFGGTQSAGFGGISSAGFGNVGNFAGKGGSSFGGLGGTQSAGAGGGFSCSACDALNNGSNPCFLALCDALKGTCTEIPVNNGIACMNSNRCASASICQNGQCIETAAVTCPVMGECNSAACDPMTGQCTQTPLTGTPCTSLDPCASAKCVSGKCVSSAPISACQSGDKCCPAGCTSNNDSDCPPAQPIVLQATDRGWYADTGVHMAVNKNTFTGMSPPSHYNSYFTFDLSGVTGTIVSAQLSLELEHFFGTDMSETASIWDVSASASQVSMSSTSTTIFQDLQSGSKYGTFTGTPAAVGTNIATTLSAQAIKDLNTARGSTFAVGVHIDSLSGQVMMDEGLRFSTQTEPRTDQLILTVQ
jgi:hypothetical protein